MRKAFDGTTDLIHDNRNGGMVILDISFILPVYNGESYIEKSIGSILKWNREPKIEILVIDDGSTDETLNFCKKIAETDRRVHLFSIENSGQSIARNYGMKQCFGRYIYFVDADDRVDVDEIYHMWVVAEQENVDVIMGGYFRVNGDHSERISLPGEGFMARVGTSEEQALYHKVKAESAFGYLWNKLYKKEFLDKNNLQMDDIRKVYMEDQLFNLKVWSKNPSWYCCDKPVYYYEVGNVSTTRRAEPQIHMKNLVMIDALIAYYSEYQILEENLDVLIPLIMRTFCWSLVKNIEYEAKSTAKMRERAKAYMDSPNVQKAIKIRGAVKMLWKLPSFLQAVFYSACMVLIRWKWSGFVAGLFYMTYPIMKKYIFRVLK